MRVLLLAFAIGTLALPARADDLPPQISLENKALLLTFTPNGAIAVQDKRTGKTWTQQPVSRDLTFTALEPTLPGEIKLDAIHTESKARVKVDIALDGDLPEFTVSITGDGDLPRALTFPQPFTGGDHLIIPLNEGVRYAVNDSAVWEMGLVTYGGHGICMPFWGLTDGDAGQMAIFETPNDGRIQIKRLNGSLCVEPQWDPQKGKFGYGRRIRYIFLSHGGYVAMCKRYRAYAQSIGLFKTLADKRAENPHVDLLIGAANVWYFWDQDSVKMAKEMIDAGITRMLWSNSLPPYVADLNQLGLLTGRYDLYQDIMDPANFPQLPWVHPDWIPQAWPAQCVVDANGKLLDGWKVKRKDGTPVACNVLSDRFAPGYARARIKAELDQSPYHARFIDTTTAAAWREDYSPDHPQTRTESRKSRMELLNVVSHEFHLVTGSETGLDTAVPYVDYFEGMLSLAPYRLPDCGNNMQQIWTAPLPKETTFQTNPVYRLPLWELVYHDCVVAHWYWGDYDNKIPALWDRRDLFNALYGTVPMFMFDRAFWAAHKDRFVQSYRATCPLARAVGYSEMVDHRLLTPDALVQQSRFANGVTVTANFGDQPYVLDPQHTVAPNSLLTQGLPAP